MKQTTDRNYTFVAGGQLLMSLVDSVLKDLSIFKIKRTIDFDIKLYGDNGTIKFSAKPYKK